MKVGRAGSQLVVKTCLSKIEADLAQSALEAAGIDAIVRADDAGGTRPGLWMGGVAVLVRAEDKEEAAKVLGVG